MSMAFYYTNLCYTNQTKPWRSIFFFHTRFENKVVLWICWIFGWEGFGVFIVRHSVKCGVCMHMFYHRDCRGSEGRSPGQEHNWVQTFMSQSLRFPVTTIITYAVVLYELCAKKTLPFAMNLYTLPPRGFIQTYENHPRHLWLAQ